MAYLLANASRVRANQNHAEHHVWAITREEYVERMKTNKTSDGIQAYDRVLRYPSSIDHKFDPNCEQCAYKRKERDEYLRRQAEDAERYRIQEEEERAKKKEREHEAAERRMMATEDKPKAAPPPKKKVTPVDSDKWRLLKEQEVALMAQVARVRAEANKIDPTKTDASTQYECKLCGVNFTASSGYPDAAKRKAHLATRKHQINAGLVEKEAYPRHCDTCDYDAKTKHAWEQHCDGKKHKAKEIQTVTIPTVQKVEEDERLGEVHSANLTEDNVEPS